MSNHAKQIVNLIVDDLRDRAGLGDEWDAIDLETQDEIKEEWVELVEEELE
jgi:Mor family transcriptional regulator